MEVEQNHSRQLNLCKFLHVRYTMQRYQASWSYLDDSITSDSDDRIFHRMIRPKSKTVSSICTYTGTERVRLIQHRRFRSSHSGLPLNERDQIKKKLVSTYKLYTTHGVPCDIQNGRFHASTVISFIFAQNFSPFNVCTFAQE
jgi:hypothetical protein